MMLLLFLGSRLESFERSLLSSDDLDEETEEAFRFRDELVGEESKEEEDDSDETKGKREGGRCCC